MAFVMLNPSTADAVKEDPTIRRCVGFARSWGYGSLSVVNLFAFRATDPSDLLSAVDAVGPENDRHIVKECSQANLTVLAWGNPPRSLTARASEVLAVLLESGIPAVCLGLTKQGMPRHPLYLAQATVPLAVTRAGDSLLTATAVTGVAR